MTAHTRVELPPEAVHRCLESLYGVTGAEVREFPGDIDATWRVQERDGHLSVLKITHPETPDSLIELEIGALLHLESRMPPGSLPRVLRTAAGKTVGTFEGYRVRRLDWLDGPLLGKTEPRAVWRDHDPLPEVYVDAGAFLARLDRAFEGFEPPAALRTHPWDAVAAAWLTDDLSVFADAEEREIIARVGEAWVREVKPRVEALPHSVIHGDAHELNLIADRRDHPSRVTGIFDFGDLLRTARVCEPAVAAAYAGMASDDPMDAICAVFSGYHAGLPLSEDEIDAALPLVRTRLAISATMSARRRTVRDDPYASVSETGAWRVLKRLDQLNSSYARARLRVVCGLEVVRGAAAVSNWLTSLSDRELEPVLAPEVMARPVALDLSIGSPMLGADPSNLETGPLGQRIDAEIRRSGGSVGVGRWNEPRPIYLGGLFGEDGAPTDERRTLHIGVDLFATAGLPIHTPIAGVVESLGDNGMGKDYGPVVLLRHEPHAEVRFWTLWGHLDPEVLDRLEPGDELQPGALLAHIGASDRNGDWPPHPHIQMVLDPLDLGHDYPGVATVREREVWCALCPDPAPLLGLSREVTACPDSSPEELRTRRRRTMGGNLSLSYSQPIEAVRGWRQHLYDADGRCWLDLYNNVPHVGHSNPRVAEAVARQSALFAANTRYLSRVRQDYLDRLLELFPTELDTAFLLPSGSEANEVALRLSEAFTGRRSLIVQDAAYHGHTTTLIGISPYKANGPGGAGVHDWVRVCDIPDPYRGSHRFADSDTEASAERRVGDAYAADVAKLIARMVADGAAPGGFFAETFPSVGGQIVPPPGYLEGVYQAVRSAGGLTIADEVQTGLGRLGSVMWGFETQGVIPDIVVLGKPMANGFPMGAVITRREIAEAFDNGMEFFSTFGGNPVACAAGHALLDVMEEESLQQNAHLVGTRLLEGLRAASVDHPAVGEIRGMGLFLGVELVQDRDRRDPAPGVAAYVVARLKEMGVLAGTDGPDHNVVKLRGPLTVGASDVDYAVDAWRSILAEPGTFPG